MTVLVTAASRHGATGEIAAAIAGRPVWLFSSGPLGPPDALEPEGDFRDWEAIDAFAGDVGARLGAEVASWTS